MSISNAKELISAIETKRDRLNEILGTLEVYKMTKSTFLSANEMKELRKAIRRIIARRDKLDNAIDKLEEQIMGRLQTTPVS